MMTTHLERSTGPAVRSSSSSATVRRRRKRAELLAGYGFLTPWLLGFVLLTLGPMIASLYLAFTDYNLFSNPTWAGLANFTRLFHDPDYIQSWKVTAGYVLIGTPLKLAAALAVAIDRKSVV